MKSLWDKRIPENIFGFVIAGYYASIEMALDNVTGGAINPARVFGPAIFSGKIFQIHIFITYMIAPAVGKFCNFRSKNVNFNHRLLAWW